MEIWAMNDEFFSMSGPANTSRKTTQPIYAKKGKYTNNIQEKHQKHKINSESLLLLSPTARWE